MKARLFTTKQKRGFTLIEMAVSIAIFAIISSVLLYKHSNFSNSVLITNLAYDIALNLRQAQVFGLSSVGQTDSSDVTNFRIGYGVHFDVSSEDAQKSFIFFADSMGIQDRTYNTESECGNSDSVDECVELIPIRNGNKIDQICIRVDQGDLECDSIETLDVVFKRPETEASIRINGNSGDTGITEAKIYLISPQDRQKIVTVLSSGQISIGDPDTE